MPKTPLTPDEATEVLSKDVVFIPTPTQRAAKARFWKRLDFDLPTNPSAAMVAQVVGASSVKRWWSVEGFSEWFLNRDEAGERLEYLYMLALDAAEQLLLDPDANHNAKVQMIKIIAQLAGKEPTKEERFADEHIQKMGSAELKQFIEKLTPKVVGGSSGSSK